MRSHVRLAGHPVHQMLIVFPLGLLATSVLFDVLALILDNRAQLHTVAYWLMAAGMLGGLVAAPFGFLDWTKIPGGTRARRIGAAHGLGNVAVLTLFFIGWMQRSPDAVPAVATLGWSFAAVLLALITAWLGGELVIRLGIGVDENAHPNAPSSLRVDEIPATPPRTAETVGQPAPRPQPRSTGSV